MTRSEDALCSNCHSGRHKECCSRCGKLVPRRRRDTGFCTERCASEQAHEDRASAEEERAEQDAAEAAE